MISRDIQFEVFNLMQHFPAVGILGPRQTGKTTLAFQIAETMNPKPVYLDLEAPSDLAKLKEPELYFETHNGRTIILDEIQRAPEIFATLRGVIDRRRRGGQETCQFLILGSASLDLLRQSSESLAGRIAYAKLSGLKITEIPETGVDKLWLRGGFPESYLANNESKSFEWRQNFMATYLERDIPQFGIRIPATTLRQFWTMLANVQGSLLNLSRLAGGLAVSVPAATRYLDLLVDLFLVRKLQPWSSNIGKRLVRSPKVYIRDSGLTHALLKIRSDEELFGHPVIGGSWEGFVIENLLTNIPDWVSPYFYRTATGTEIDLFIQVSNKKKIAIEVKRTLSPSLTKGFQIACEDLKATHKYFVYPGRERFPLAKEVFAISLRDLMEELKVLVNEDAPG